MSRAKLLEGKRALITGGPRGLGRVMCELLASGRARAALAYTREERCAECALVRSLAHGLLEDGVGKNVPEHRLADYVKHCALGRVGTLEEVARFAAFLVSEKNGYMTGETIVMDGGV